MPFRAQLLRRMEDRNQANEGNANKHLHNPYILLGTH